MARERSWAHVQCTSVGRWARRTSAIGVLDVKPEPSKRARSSCSRSAAAARPAGELHSGAACKPLGNELVKAPLTFNTSESAGTWLRQAAATVQSVPLYSHTPTGSRSGAKEHPMQEVRRAPPRIEKARGCFRKQNRISWEMSRFRVFEEIARRASRALQVPMSVTRPRRVSPMHHPAVVTLTFAEVGTCRNRSLGVTIT